MLLNNEIFYLQPVPSSSAHLKNENKNTVGLDDYVNVFFVREILFYLLLLLQMEFFFHVLEKKKKRERESEKFHKKKPPKEDMTTKLTN